MSDALIKTRRDIVYSLANNTNQDTAAELAQISNSTRKSADLQDNWESFKDIAFSQDSWAALTKPGHFDDPDMLVLGMIGWGEPRPTRLTPDEQYSHMSLWCLLSAPLLLGCDLERLDPFTLSLITNDEVLEVNQDPLCQQATKVGGQGDAVVYAKSLEDGSIAVGLFNRSESEANVAVSWSELGINGRHAIRDLWRQKALGVFPETFDANIPRHGVVLIRVTKAE
jgi:alpha-galactosidase